MATSSDFNLSECSSPSSSGSDNGDFTRVKSGGKWKKLMKKMVEGSKKSIYGSSKPMVFSYDAVSYSLNFDEGNQSEEFYMYGSRCSQISNVRMSPALQGSLNYLFHSMLLNSENVDTSLSCRTSTIWWIPNTRCKQAPRYPSLNKDFGDFVRNFNMHCVGKTVSDLHALLIDYEKGLKDKAPTPQLWLFKPKPKQNPPQKKENPKKDQACHYCNVVGHWKRNCPLYLEELRTNKNKKAEHGAAPSGNLFMIELFNLTHKLNSWVYDIGCGIHIYNTLQGFRVERKLSYGEQYLHVGNGAQAAVEAIGVFNLVLPSGLVLSLNNCHYAPSIVRGKNGIVQHLTSPQQNGVSERRNRTLLDMVRSMFNLTTLPLSFWDYALESVIRILNMVPTKKVDKTPYEIWHGKV
ncbi:retrotransposon protein, putative, ty1-copia subclass [Tanacetum coccineum]